MKKKPKTLICKFRLKHLLVCFEALKELCQNEYNVTQSSSPMSTSRVWYGNALLKNNIVTML